MKNETEANGQTRSLERRVRPLRAVMEQVAGHHNRLQNVLWKAAKEKRERIEWLENHPEDRPDFARGDKWPATREHNLRQADWDEKCAAEHAEFDTAVRELLKHKLPDEE